jgi:DNA-binding LytR/AlgR family response regulator
MHYTAMAGLLITPHAEAAVSAPALSTDLLAIVVAVVAFAASGIFLLTLVPDRRGQGAARASEAEESSGPSRAPLAGYSTATADMPLTPTSPVTASPMGDLNARPAPVRILPIVRDGATHFLAVRDIVAIHANAHYTTVFDGKSKLFCPLPISEVEARLDHTHFARVHRSHIVNLERVVGLKRAGDQGVIELSGLDPYVVPVSRSRFGGLKSQLGLGPREAAVS